MGASCKFFSDVHRQTMEPFRITDDARELVKTIDRKLRCNEILDNEIHDRSRQPVGVCLTSDTCHATSYDTDVLDRMVTCSAMYEFVKNAPCNDDSLFCRVVDDASRLHRDRSLEMRKLAELRDSHLESR